MNAPTRSIIDNCNGLMLLLNRFQAIKEMYCIESRKKKFSDHIYPIPNTYISSIRCKNFNMSMVITQQQ